MPSVSPTPDGHPSIDEIIDARGMGPWWYACLHPDHRPDRWTIWSWACDDCTRHMRDWVVLYPDNPSAWLDHSDLIPLERNLEAGRTWREAQGLTRI